MLKILALVLVLSPAASSIKCLDCVGKDCMGSFCEGDYCILSQYAPRWGTFEWGKPQVVKGCVKGSLLRNDIQDHCEAADEEGREKFTCFCKGRDHCNGGRALTRLKVEAVDMIRCECSGSHCKEDTCIGELCSYVVNHKTKKTEKGCVNASVPLIERRSMGACMMPPITGAMHHTVAKDAADLLNTESCVCAENYCNAEKPKITVPERQKCQMFVDMTVIGSTTKSKNITCTGEFCFKVHIRSKLGLMSEYKTMGCASFTGFDPLAEELNPIGCAKFESEQLSVMSCFKTTDKGAIDRARANMEVKEAKEERRPSKGKNRKPPPKMEIEYEDDEMNDDNDDDAEMESKPEPKQEKTPPAVADKEDEEEEEEEEVEEESSKGDDDSDKKESGSTADEPATTNSFIFERPTQPPIPDDSNTTMIAVFVLIILCIVVSGAVWKFELHKKLFRSSYDTVAGG
ncbi:unnamed protein product [Nippostrongylus brasiliensis]|uniref:Activin_recp domain-containing protein n=1 Tax=Nippostrongylus brasiliensis TaxID=27835 RepID=A0A0N4YAK9_NIPBR|nr:unnamed protein product [Nippostrongylus brasiliensis]